MCHIGTGTGVAHLPEQVSHRYRNCVREVEVVCNFFGPWEDQTEVIARALGWVGPAPTLEYEKELKIGRLRGTPPTLDVLLTAESTAWGIESKFTEPFQPWRQRKAGDKAFRPSYFKDESIWDGLPRCQALADRLYRATQPEFRHLDAPQLIKHALGLHARYPGAAWCFCVTTPTRTKTRGSPRR